MRRGATLQITPTFPAAGDPTFSDFKLGADFKIGLTG